MSLSLCTSFDDAYFDPLLYFPIFIALKPVFITTVYNSQINIFLFCFFFLSLQTMKEIQLFIFSLVSECVVSSISEQ